MSYSRHSNNAFEDGRSQAWLRTLARTVQRGRQGAAMHSVRFLAVFTFLVLPSLSSASDRQYECIVKQVWQVEKGGTAYVPSPIANLHVGRTFKIDRATGKIESDFLAYPELKVISRGSKQQPFIAETHSVNSQFLRIEEFRDTALKPFILVDVIDVKIGECK